MANRKTLKQSVKDICTELFAEGVAASLYGTGKNQENTESTLYSIIKLEDDFVCRISHIEPGMKPKVYFRNLIEEFNARVCETIDQISNLQ